MQIKSCQRVCKFGYMKLVKPIILTALASALVSCDNFEYHPYSVYIDGETAVNVKYTSILENSGLTPPFKFAFITDTQGALDDMSDALDIIRQRGDIDFIIHGGDQTDFGLPKEFMWCRDMLEDAGLPYVAVIGNHDCLGNGNDTFDYMYGPENFSFNVGPVHFVCLNTVALEYDYSHPVPDFEFIQGDIEHIAMLNHNNPATITHTIVVMHSRPYDEQFNNNVARPFNHYITQYPGLGSDDGRIVDESDGILNGSMARGFCINGHNHADDIADIYGNGVLYYQCANMAKRTFFVFTVTDDGYDYEKVVY